MTKNNPSSKRIALLQEQWDHIRNKNLKLKDFTFGSGVKVWWKCSISDDHIWETSIIKRMEGNDCPFCAGRLIAKSNSLSTTNSEIAKQWHPTRNGKLLPDHVYKGSHKKVWWLCDRNKFHEWESAINTRVLGSNCPICAGKKVDNTNSLNITHPHIAKQWHPTKNGNLQPNNFTFGSSKKVWWKCDKYKDHEWEASINKRVNGQAKKLLLQIAY